MKPSFDNKLMVENTHFIVVVKIGGLSMITTIQSLYKQIGRLLTLQKNGSEAAF